jgi:hypothetical protein
MGRHSSAVEMSATMYPISEFGFVDGHSGASTPGQGPVHGPRDRFKVVRIETSAPQKRGRWTCIEYADKNSSTSSVAQAPSTTTAAAEVTVTSEPAVAASTEQESSQQQQQQSVPPQHLPTSQQQPHPQQQQLLSPNTSKIPLSIAEEIESLIPVNL